MIRTDTRQLSPSRSTQSGLGFQLVREAGGDRYATVVAIAAALDNPVAVLLADRTTYGDALDAGSTAVETNGAVPWTDGPTLPAVTAAFLAADSTSTVSALSVPAVTADSAPAARAGADCYASAAAGHVENCVCAGQAGCAPPAELR